MRVRGSSLVMAGLAAVTYSAQGQPVDPTSVLAAAREALGGESRLGAIKTFTITGRTRQVRGNNLVPIEFEINCELPAKFVRARKSLFYFGSGVTFACEQRIPQDDLQGKLLLALLTTFRQHFNHS